MDLKKEAARAALDRIANQSSVGLGAGATIAHLVFFLKEAISRGLETRIYTSSFSTKLLLQDAGIPILDTGMASRLDFYLDSCDQVDPRLNALKSGGGIHTSEKLLASMAAEFIILGDQSKYVQQLDVKFPLVLEILPEAWGYVTAKIKQAFPEATPQLRKSDKYDGAVMTRNGNYLLDCWFPAWPELGLLDTKCKNITGIVGSSLFYKLAHRAIIAGDDGVKIYEP